eukprot:jgi/Botrbrau1/1830/Bobra.146_1s0025.1
MRFQLHVSISSAQRDYIYRKTLKHYFHMAGDINNGAPERVQGIWWADGLGDPTLAVNLGGGEYHSKARMLTINTYSKSLFAVDATNSTWQGFSWSMSGAAFFNAMLFAQIVYHIYFNEDFTYGQIIPTRNVLGALLSTPTWIDDLHMEWMGHDTWERKTILFTMFDAKGGDYYFRRIINANGSQGYWFDKGWLSYRNGMLVAVGFEASL